MAFAIPPTIMQSVTGLGSGQLTEVAIIGRGRSLHLLSLGVDFSLLDLLAKAMVTPAEAKASGIVDPVGFGGDMAKVDRG